LQPVLKGVITSQDLKDLKKGKIKANQLRGNGAESNAGERNLKFKENPVDRP
jgi:hypothetical protein